ncbi:MAG TPA: hypothetical protein VMK66_08805 [Myxococcales bacterium]|nr:hypothetical protein [Myxococcales bacterium]
MSGEDNGHEQLCVYLRAKVTGAAHNDRRALYALRTEATTVYWCLLTMSPAGPDDGLVHAGRCSTGRTCCTLDEETGVA